MLSMLLKIRTSVPLVVVRMLKDYGDTPITEGGAKIQAVLHDPKEDIPVQIVDNNDGTYACSYVPETAISYKNTLGENFAESHKPKDGVKIYSKNEEMGTYIFQNLLGGHFPFG